MGMKEFAVNDCVTAEEIKNVRKSLGLTQKEFARLIGSSKPTVERWEREQGTIKGPIVLLIKMLCQYPDYVEKLEIPEKSLPVRMWYMYKNTKCTLIDVDETKQLVRIKNYTDNVMFMAFGNNTNPDIEDYREFLKSRCFLIFLFSSLKFSFKFLIFCFIFKLEEYWIFFCLFIFFLCRNMASYCS